MAIVSRMVSDITGVEADESEFVKLVVRSHPATDEPKALDALPDEIKGFKEAKDLVSLEIKDNGESRQIVVSLADFRKVVPDEAVKNASGTRGRRPGYRPAT